MSDELNSVVPRERPLAFDSGSPRWQLNTGAPGEVERYRRYRMDAGPRQPGALDQEGSVPGSASRARSDSVTPPSKE